MKSPDQKPKSTMIGTLLLMGATAAATYLAATRKKEILDGLNKMATAGAALAQKVTEGGLEVLTATKQNGASRTAPLAN